MVIILNCFIAVVRPKPIVVRVNDIIVLRKKGTNAEMLIGNVNKVSKLNIEFNWITECGGIWRENDTWDRCSKKDVAAKIKYWSCGPMQPELKEAIAKL